MLARVMEQKRDWGGSRVDINPPKELREREKKSARRGNQKQALDLLERNERITQKNPGTDRGKEAGKPPPAERHQDSSRVGLLWPTL